jgi:hypothetical protein
MAGEQVGPRTRSDLIRDRFGLVVQVNRDPGTTVVGLTATQLLNQSPNRLALTIINNGTGRIWLFPGNNPSVTHGIVLAAGGGQVSLVWDDDWDVLGFEWWAIAEVAATPISIIEVVAR